MFSYQQKTALNKGGFLCYSHAELVSASHSPKKVQGDTLKLSNQELCSTICLVFLFRTSEYVF